ncbi:MAG: hypothetical protein ACWGO2_03920 [Syntrophobacteria bacterium]|jgi:hypothetical protein
MNTDQVEKKEQVEEFEREESESAVDPVDLNRVFQEEGRDLNSMFPDGEMRKFLKQVDKNRRSNQRFLKGMKRDKLWEEDE